MAQNRQKYLHIYYLDNKEKIKHRAKLHHIRNRIRNLRKMRRLYYLKKRNMLADKAAGYIVDNL